MSLNVLLIGGSGFVSGSLSNLAIRAGHNVWAVTRGNSPLPEGVRGIKVDRHDASFERIIDGVGVCWDFVVDCIGYDAPDASQDIDVFKPRAKHLVFISTDFVFDPVRRQFPQTQDCAHFLNEGYGGLKRKCEMEFINRDTGDMAWTIVRPCHIYGPGSLLGCLPEHSRDPDLIKKLRRGQKLKLVGGGYFLTQPIFVRDLAETILSCEGNRKTHRQIYPVAGPDIIECREYYRLIAAILDVKFRTPDIAL